MHTSQISKKRFLYIIAIKQTSTKDKFQISIFSHILHPQPLIRTQGVNIVHIP